MRARGRIWTKPNSRAAARRRGEVHRELDLDRRAHPALPLLHERREHLGEREPALLQDRGEGHEAGPRARQSVVDGVVLRRSRWRPRRGACRPPRPRRGRRTPRACPPSAVPPSRGRAQNSALRRVQHVFDGRELQDVLRVARTEADARPALDDRAAHAERDGHDPVPARPSAARGRSCASGRPPRSPGRSGRPAAPPRSAGGSPPSSPPPAGRGSPGGRPWRACEKVEA